MEGVKLVECPRDAMRVHRPFIPTDVKVAYLDTLLKVGFDTIDIGSFVEPQGHTAAGRTPRGAGLHRPHRLAQKACW
ncbi:MAG: hypothetical protein IPM68_14320 [Flavobacteriales bacterium]|nr:hypothetical protein [Flavobacteriales bacterium]